MSSYLALNFRNAGGVNAIDLCGVSNFPYFTPVGIGGFADGKWILAGQGLEHFAYSYSQTRIQRKKLEFLFVGEESSAGRSEVSYFRSIANLARSGKCEQNQLSPNEILNDRVGATFLGGESVTTADWEEICTFVAKSTQWSLHVYGRFSLVAQPFAGVDWNNSFRYVEDLSKPLSLPEPFVVLQIGTTHEDSLYLQLFSQATIWIDNMASLNGLIELTDSRENLDRLSCGARHILSKCTQLKDSELILSGGNYPYRTAFEAAFGGIVNRVSLS